MTTETETAENETSAIDQETPTTKTVELTAPQWSAICQLVSVGTRHSDDSVLAIGGGLLAEIKRQLSESNEPH